MAPYIWLFNLKPLQASCGKTHWVELLTTVRKPPLLRLDEWRSINIVWQRNGVMRRIGALIFPEFELLDVFGPMEMFGVLEQDYSLELVAEIAGPVASNQGLSAHATKTIDQGTDYDILFVPGGAGTRREVSNSKLLDWIGKASENAEFTLSVCTGSALLAKAGVLDNRRATTNKAAFAWVAEQGPNVDWVRQARWVEDGPFITSSGVSAGMDMALGAIATMHDIETAEKVAQWCEYSWHQDKTWDPFAAIHGLV
ncbi:MAG: transcriptional regulator GlxA family with amidase domain [Paracoccaceae bacterium]